MEKQFKKEYLKILEKLRNLDNLIPSSELIFRENNGDFDLYLRSNPEIRVFPHVQLYDVVKLLAKDSQLWNNSSLDVTIRPPMVARAPIFGVPLGKTISEALKTGIQKSKFSIVNESGQEGFVADLLLFLGTNPKSGPETRELQVWENINGSNEVFYGHAIFTAESLSVNHLDCATMYLTEEQKNILFYKAKKIKGENYSKHFRVDGNFSLQLATNLMKAYFPIEELSNEAFSINEI